MTYGGYSQTNGFSNNESNLSRRTNLAQTLGLNYRSDIIDFGIRGNINYNNVRNSLEGQRIRNISITTHLPTPFSICRTISPSRPISLITPIPVIPEDSNKKNGCGTLPAKQVFKQKTAPFASKYTIFYNNAATSVATSRPTIFAIHHQYPYLLLHVPLRLSLQHLQRRHYTRRHDARKRTRWEDPAGTRWRTRNVLK